MLEIEIVYGTAEKQILRSIRIEQGATARTAVLQSGLDKDFPELDLKKSQRRRFVARPRPYRDIPPFTD